MSMSIGLVWFYSLFWASLPVFSSYGPEPFGTSCTINWWGMRSSLIDRVYILLILIMCFFLPTLTIVASYVTILLTFSPRPGGGVGDREQPASVLPATYGVSDSSNVCQVSLHD
uniref:G-protein coupled receptors family 1 profile domain-containing protein n=1 Tax=Hucho hucho TaxID=62062 RepID=A0A4W5Q9R1_9TELE